MIKTNKTIDTKIVDMILYITGETENGINAVKHIKDVFGKHKIKYTLKIIDILKNPQIAEEERILATPVLVKETPPPFRRVVGDLSDVETLVDTLSIGGLIT